MGLELKTHDSKLRTPALLLVGILLYALAGWAAYELLGPRLIDAIYRGHGPTALTRLLESRETIPLSTYQARGRTLFLGFHAFVVWLGLCGILQLRYRLLDRATVSPPRSTVLAALAAFGLAPFVLLKCLLLAALLAAAVLRKPVTLASSRVAVALIGLWGAAFLLAPAWMTVTRSPWLPAILVGLGVIWAMRAAGRVTLSASGVSSPSVFMLTLGLLLLNYAALTAPIAWRGDEGYHIAIVLTVIQNPFWLAAAAVAAAALWWGRPGSWSTTLRLSMVVAVTFVLVGRTYPDQTDAAARYPFASRWLEALPVQLLSFWPSLVRQEAFFRLIPFASGVLIATLALSRLRDRPALAWLTAAAVATTPLVLYYTSILYLEMPAVLLGIVVSLSLREIVETDGATLRESGAWLALLALAFLKETTIPFLGAVVATRLAVQARRMRTGRSTSVGRSFRLRAKRFGETRPPTLFELRRDHAEALAKAGRSLAEAVSVGSTLAELELAALVLAPMAVYLLLRTAGGAPREYGFALGQIFSWGPYLQVAQSWLEQAPALVVLFVAGSFWLALSGELLLAAFSWLVVAATTVFIAGDTPIYAGYSRFNLLILPVLIATALACLKKLASRRPLAASLMTVVWLAANWLSSPFHVDGSRVPQWGSRIAQIADYTYPYADALAWIRDRHGSETLVATGLDYPYPYDFYFRQLRWQPPFRVHLIPAPPITTQEELDRIFREAAPSDATIVLYHVRREDVPPPARVGAFEVEHVFNNRAHRLIVYRRGP